MTSSERVTTRDTTALPFGKQTHVSWKTRQDGAKRQERLMSYMSNKLVLETSKAGEKGVVDNREYKINSSLQDKRKEISVTAIQIRGRETAKEEYIVLM